MCFGQPNELFQSWKVWERAVAQVAVEIVSESSDRARGWSAKLRRYEDLGVSEVLRFDSVASEQPLRIWERVGARLIERRVGHAPVASRVLPGFWLVIDDPEVGLILRLSHDEQGAQLFLSAEEQHAEAARKNAEAANHHAATSAQLRANALLAEQRIRELEAELRRRQP